LSIICSLQQAEPDNNRRLNLAILRSMLATGGSNLDDDSDNTADGGTENSGPPCSINVSTESSTTVKDSATSRHDRTSIAETTQVR
jgi:hypothetical protein